MPDDDFTLVTRRRKLRVSIPSSSRRIAVQGAEDTSVNKDLVLTKIHDAKNTFVGSEFLGDVISALKDALKLTGSDSICEIICYGLGHFTECAIARYQLALLLIIQNIHKAVVYIHDPVFYKCEVELLEDLGLLPVLENEEGKRLVDSGVTTLLYFPHCSKQLTNNFLWRNWGSSLSDCIIFGNSFTSVLDRQLASDTGSVSFIERIYPYVKELELKNNFVFSDIFNNTSVHVFPQDKLSVVEPSFWTEECKEPSYKTADTEFITREKDDSPTDVANTEATGI